MDVAGAVRVYGYNALWRATGARRAGRALINALGAPDAAEARALLQSYQPDILLADCDVTDWCAPPCTAAEIARLFEEEPR